MFRGDWMYVGSDAMVGPTVFIVQVSDRKPTPALPEPSTSPPALTVRA